MAHGYRVILEKLPLDAYSTDTNATVGACVLLEPYDGVPLGASRASR